jgi:hypothetical protein
LRVALAEAPISPSDEADSDTAADAEIITAYRVRS